MLGRAKKKAYKSPCHKQVKFLSNSRDQWKAKCRQAKATVKQLNNRVRYLEKSREQWKEKAKELQAQHKELQAQLSAKEKEYKELQAQLSAKEKELQRLKEEQQSQQLKMASLKDFPARHQYSLGQIMLFISLVFSAATSLRGASRVMEIISNYLPLPFKAPSWFTGRFWILRLGYYKLMRAKEQANDWVWIVDHTVQVGSLKCLVILGIRLSSLPKKGNCLTHQDVEPIALLPVTQSNGEIVSQQLENTIRVTGVPREIIADHGSDLKSGIEKFCAKHKETSFIYDIKHKTARVLKKVLSNDSAWIAFTKLASQSKNKIQQTALAPLAPPNQRTKARYMNIDILIGWGCKMLAFLDRQTIQPQANFDPQQVTTKLGWVVEFRQQLEEWGRLLQLVSITEKWVRRQGLYRNSHLDLKELLIEFTQTPRERRVCQDFLDFVEQESLKCKANERLLGSSEVIESAFGKLKRLEQQQAKSGFTSLLLSLAAILSPTSLEVVQEAMETVETKKILLWQKNVLGKSVQARRREAFAEPNQTESK